MTDELSDADLAYIAGFFDGEGSLTIHENWRPSPRGKSPNHTLQISIGNTHPMVLLWLQKHFGGQLVYRDRSHKPNHRNFCVWVIRANQTIRFMDAIYPYVRMKKEQFAIAMAFQKSKPRYSRNQLTQEAIDWREAQRAAIRELNAKEHIVIGGPNGPQ